jgi:hypothetical protein
LTVAVASAATPRKATTPAGGSTRAAAVSVAAPVPEAFDFLPILQPLAPGSAGMIAVLDPETGVVGAPSLLPFPVFPEATDPMLDSQAGLVEEPALSGFMIDLKGRFQEFAVMRLDAKGHLHFSCGPNPADILNGPAPAAVVEE